VILATDAGRVLAAELMIVDQLETLTSGGALPSASAPTAGFEESVRAWWASTNAAVAAEAKVQAEPMIKQIEEQTALFIGVSVSIPIDGGGTRLGSPQFGGTFSYRNATLNLSAPAQGGLLVSGSWGGLPLGTILVTPPPSEFRGAAADWSRAAADAGVATTPSRSVASSSVVVPVSGSIRVALSPGALVRPAESSDTQLLLAASRGHAAVTVAWGALPSLPAAWLQPKLGGSNRTILSGLIVRAAPHLTTDEVALVNAAIASGSLPESVVEVLVRRAEQAATSGRWLRTSAVAEIVQEPAGPCPVEGCNDPARQSAIARGVQDRNARARQSFEAASAEAKTRLRTDRIFTDGLPAVSLTVGNDYSVLEWRYDYQIVGGGSITLSIATQAPDWLRTRMRTNPGEQWLEKLSVLAAGPLLDGPDPSRAILRRAEAGLLKDAQQLNAQLAEVVDAAGTTLGTSLRTSAEEYYKALSDWTNSEAGAGSGGGVKAPFEPPGLGAALTPLLPPPFEVVARRDQAVSEVVTAQRETDLARAVRSGAISPELTQPATDWAEAAASIRLVTPAMGKRIAEKAIAAALDYQSRGVKYRSPPSGTNTADCSHFCADVLDQAGFAIPYHTSRDFANSQYFREVPASEAQAGDIIWQPRTTELPGAGHVGIYTGERNAKGNPLGVQMGNKGARTAVWGPRSKTGGDGGGWFDGGEQIKFYRPIAQDK
jgi:cell wall-associated NlpC family hydrolase